MDKTKFKEVKGVEALKVLTDGGRLTDKDGWEYWLNAHSTLVFLDDEDLSEGKDEYEASVSQISFNNVVESVWYLPKPFDIRDVALERPNEWVGAYYEPQSRVLYKVGFDKELMKLIEAVYENPFECSYRRVDTNTLNPSIKFEDMFPIEQVDRPMTVDKPKAFDTDVPF